MISVEQSGRGDVDVVQGLRILPDRDRVADAHEQVADAERVRAEQIALEPQQVAPSRREVQHGLDAGFLVDRAAGRPGAHAHLRHRRIGDVDHVGARLAQGDRGGHQSGDAGRPRRLHLDRDHEPAGRPDAACNALGAAGVPARRAGRACEAGRAVASTAPAGGDRERGGDRRGVLGTGAAAPTHDRRALVDGRDRVLGDVRGRRRVDDPASRPGRARRRSGGRRPACRRRGRTIARTMRSTCAGPSPQFTPIASAPSATSRAATCSGVEPSGVRSSRVKVALASTAEPGRSRRGPPRAPAPARAGRSASRSPAGRHRPRRAPRPARDRRRTASSGRSRPYGASRIPSGPIDPPTSAAPALRASVDHGRFVHRGDPLAEPVRPEPEPVGTERVREDEPGTGLARTHGGRSSTRAGSSRFQDSTHPAGGRPARRAATCRCRRRRAAGPSASSLGRPARSMRPMLPDRCPDRRDPSTAAASRVPSADAHPPRARGSACRIARSCSARCTSHPRRRDRRRSELAGDATAPRDRWLRDRGARDRTSPSGRRAAPTGTSTLSWQALDELVDRPLRGGSRRRDGRR